MGIEVVEPAGRTLHLVDLENLLGDDRLAEHGEAGLAEYLRLACWAPGDHVIVAAHPELVRQIGFAPPVPCNLHATCGPDAADEMLLGLISVEQTIARYERLVIGSGDGIFFDRAREVRDQAVPVVVVARPDGVAARFRRWAFPVVPFRLDAVASVAVAA